MNYASLPLSSKYQIVIPLAARKKMGLDKTVGQRLIIERVTENEIVLRKEPALADFFGAYADYFPKNTSQELRKMRDEDWA